MIVATTGFAPGERAFYESLRKSGVVVATTFPSGDHLNSPQAASEAPPVVAIKHLLPTHARILMMLALTKTKDPREIQAIFDEY